MDLTLEGEPDVTTSRRVPPRLGFVFPFGLFGSVSVYLPIHIGTLGECPLYLLWTYEEGMPLGHVLMLIGVGRATWACPDARWGWTVLSLAFATLQPCRKGMDIIFDFFLIFS